MTDQLRQAAQDVVSAFSAALTEMESSLGDMVRESNCEGGTQFDTVRGYKALWAAQVELENLRAALAAQPAEPVAPDGWVKVPVEPTAKMVDQGVKWEHFQSYKSVREIYRAMLAAAPKEGGAA